MMTKEAMKLALEALEGLEALLLSMGLTHLIVYGDAEKAITNLQEALAEQPAQHVLEVRVWRDKNHDQHAEFRGYDKLPDGEHVFYTSPQPAQQEQESWEDLHNALQRIDTAAVGLPTFEVLHEGGLDAVTQNIVDAITALHTQPAQPQQEPVAHSVIAGALFDFMGWLTSREERLVLSSADEASSAVDAIRDFAKMRGFSLDDAKVQDWRTSPPAQRKPLTFSRLCEIEEAITDKNGDVSLVKFARAIEAAHGIKENT